MLSSCLFIFHGFKVAVFKNWYVDPIFSKVVCEQLLVSILRKNLRWEFIVVYFTKKPGLPLNKYFVIILLRPSDVYMRQ